MRLERLCLDVAALRRRKGAMSEEGCGKAHMDGIVDGNGRRGGISKQMRINGAAKGCRGSSDDPLIDARLQ